MKYPLFAQFIGLFFLVLDQYISECFYAYNHLQGRLLVVIHDLGCAMEICSLP